MAGGGGSISDGEPEFQVAPMIDVLLTILVFFMMITSAQVLKVDKNIKLPVSKNALKKDNNRKQVIINVSWIEEEKKAIYKVDESAYSNPEDLTTVLTQRKAEADKEKVDGPPFRAVIRGDRLCPAVYISHVMTACASAGIADVSFSAVNKNY
jgi:biopolymer transport protein ExbD